MGCRVGLGSFERLPIGGKGDSAPVTDVSAEVGLILGLLVAMTALVGLAGRLSLPAPIVLVVGGLAIGFVPGLPDIALDPDLVLFVLLPPLLLSAAYTTSLRDVRTYAWPIASLSIGLVVATICAVAVMAHAVIPGMGWPVAFALGAIVAPPDAVAATSITSRLGVPRRLAVILEGESLVNDATALTTYRIAVAAAIAAGGSAFSLIDAGRDFLVAGAGGVLLGWAIAHGMLRLNRVIEDPGIAITVSFLAPYAAYLVADEAGTSGVIAVVVYGLIQGWRDDSLAVRVRVQGTVIWSQVTFLLTGLVFVLIGLQLPGILDGITEQSIPALLGYAALVSATVVAVRIVWNAVIPWVVRPITRNFYAALSWPELTVVGWAGMRGVVTLAAALALPLTTDDGAPFPQRDLVIFLAFSVILTTLIVQGLTLPLVIRRLGVTGDDGEERVRNKANIVALRAALDRLDELEGDGAAGDAVDDIRSHYENRLRVYRDGFKGRSDPDATRRHKDFGQLKTELIRAEADAISRLRDEEYFSDDILREIRRDLDLERLRLDG